MMAMAQVALNEDMFTADVIADPYPYYSRLREDDPVHWNALYELWVITRNPNRMWLLGRAFITVWGRRWHVWRARRSLKP